MVNVFGRIQALYSFTIYHSQFTSYYTFIISASLCAKISSILRM